MNFLTSGTKYKDFMCVCVCVCVCVVWCVCVFDLQTNHQPRTSHDAPTTRRLVCKKLDSGNSGQPLTQTLDPLLRQASPFVLLHVPFTFHKGAGPGSSPPNYLIRGRATGWKGRCAHVYCSLPVDSKRKARDGHHTRVGMA